jgi:hypothetical protein
MDHLMGRLSLSCVLDENGRRMHLSMPVEMGNNGYVQIMFDGDVYMAFEKIKEKAVLEPKE